MKIVAMLLFVLLSRPPAFCQAGQSEGRIIYPAQNGKLILNESCRPGIDLKWNPGIMAATNGLKKGDPVLAITKSGVIPARLGDLECLVGVCKANYVGVDVVSEAKSEVLAVVKSTDLEILKAVTLNSVLVEAQQCESIYPEIANERFPEVESERECRRIALPGTGQLLLARKGFQQENGWITYGLKGRILRAPRMGGNISPVFDVDSDTNPLEPLLGFVNGDGTNIVWRKASGIRGPSRVTVQLSVVNEAGAVTFGEPRAAGGQPCD